MGVKPPIRPLYNRPGTKPGEPARKEPVVALKDLLGGGVPTLSVTPSRLETARFGMSVGRMTIPRDCAHGPAVIAAVANAACDLTILRYDASDVHLAAELTSPDHVIWQADTLLYFDAELTELPRGGGPDLRQLARGQANDLSDAVRDVFADYPNHYASNPWISADKIADGYAEWAVAHLHSEVGAAVLLNDPTTGTNVAVCTLTLDSGLAEITLAGVRSNARERGVYRQLLSSVEAWLLERGAVRVTISTQAGNPTPIRAWVARGYQYRSAWNTVHVMSRRAIAGAPHRAS